MGHKLVEIHFVRLQCFVPTLNGVTPKTIFCHNTIQIYVKYVNISAGPKPYHLFTGTCLAFQHSSIKVRKRTLGIYTETFVGTIHSSV